MSPRTPIALALALAIACPVASVSAAPKKPKRPVAAKKIKQAKELRLRAFDTCEGFLGYVRGQALRQVTPYGLPGYGGGLVLDTVAGGEATRAAAAPQAAPAASAPVKGVDYSGTNTQEEDVDEPDLVKTDGRRIFTLARGKLRALDVSGAAPKLVGSLPVDESWGGELLVSGDRLVILSNGGPNLLDPQPATGSSDVAPGGVARSLPYFYRPTATLTEVDVTDPAKMRIVRRMTVDGRYVSARMTGSTARVVITSGPSRFEFVGPQEPGPAAEAQAKAKNSQLIMDAPADAWLPRYAVQEGTDGAVRKGALVGCDDVRYPKHFAGLNALSVLTIDLSKGLVPVDQDAVMSDADTVYASKDSLYVATTRWFADEDKQPNDRAPRINTHIHRFAIGSPTETSYRATGSVPGFMLSQWSMSEHKGVLRVATTEAPPWWGDRDEDTQSYVTTMGETSGALVTLGRVGGLGKGETIQAVRFIGDIGYVVTFRRIDPLYVVDVSEPVRPRVRGELKIPGYSAYLHPIGPGLLLGVGQDADENGRVLGTQVSVFDVSSPENPRRLQNRVFRNAWSEAEWDHKAFLYWPATGLTMLPITGGEVDRQTGFYNFSARAIGLRATRDGITEIGSVTHPRDDEYASIRRSVIVGKRVFTVSDLGIQASAIDSLARESWLPFA